jgi:thiamine pyrophosphokinase
MNTVSISTGKQKEQKKLFKILENDDKNINATDGGIGVVR